MRKLYFGDNIHILREYIPDESVDLIYLDPPFNSSRDYNLLFKSPDGAGSDAQIMAFEDTWHWNLQAEHEFQEITKSHYSTAIEMMIALRRALGENDMSAYLVMMANRLIELHRVLKPNGTLFLHCDTTAGHYLKVLLDSIFGRDKMIRHFTWKRTSAHSDAKQGAKRPGAISDFILWYAKGDKWTHNVQYQPYDEDYIEEFYRYVEEGTGRRYRLDNLTGPGKERKGNPEYEVMGVTRHWRYSKANMQKLIDEGRVVQTAPGNVPAYKRYLDEMPGMPLQDIWIDIKPVQSRSKEATGYPTQKPLALLERIVKMASNAGDVVLDPFCGCGTAVHAAEKLGRPWIGIDITHLAILKIEKRLQDAFPNMEYEVIGTPKDVAGAADLARRNKFQFEWWVCAMLNAQPHPKPKKGADKGKDGIIYFADVQNKKPVTQKMIVSIKGGENIGVAMIRELITVVKQQSAEMGLFVTLNPPTKNMVQEAVREGFYQAGNGQQYPRIQILTVEELLAGKRPQYVDFSLGNQTYKRGKAEKPNIVQNSYFEPNGDEDTL